MTQAEPTPHSSTPILVGAGQAVWREPPSTLADGQVPHPMDLCAEAAKRALASCEAKGDLERSLQSITVIRMFEDSSPGRAHDFGRSNNPPRSLARRIGAEPSEAIYSTAGGETPQRKVNQLCERIARGDIEAALLAGVENVATTRQAKRLGARLDLSEIVDGSLEDEGFGSYWFDQHQLAHRVAAPIHCYPLLEHAVRRDRGHDNQRHLESMARLFARISEVAANNPHAYRQRSYTAAELSAESAENRMISHPYRRLMNARDSVDQSSAVVLVSVGRARQLRIPEERWVYLNGCSELNDKILLLDREHLHRSRAARRMTETAMTMAGIDVSALESLDLYSCFPSAVEIVAREMGIAEDDPRGLSTTGGLPFFGGPGNSYSLHAIVEAVERARARPGTYHWVSANGGNINKQAAGIYSTHRVQGIWQRPDPRSDQAWIDSLPTPATIREPQGRATVETYTVAFDGDAPAFGIVVGRDSEQRRFLAAVPEKDAQTLETLLSEGLDAVGRATTRDGLSSFQI